MELLLLSGGLTIAGIYFLARNISHMRDENKLRAYLEKSPKAKLWVKKLGMDKTVRLSKAIFLPLGTLVAFGFLVVGMRGLLFHFGLLN